MGREERPHRTTPHWLTARTAGLLTIGLAAVVLVIIAVISGRDSSSRAERGAPPPVATSPVPTVAPSPTAARTSTPTPEPTEPPRAAFIGDSYTQGGGAESHDHRWSTVAARDLGWIEENFGRGGTGFVTTNSFLGCGLEYCPTYVEMVAEVSAIQPDIVVVAGGQNDFPAFTRDPDGVRAAVWETYHSLRAGLPDATIVAVGPSTPWGVDDIARALDEAVRDAAASVGAVYISMIDPDVIDPAHSLGDGHVGNDGHRAIADRVVAAFAE